MGSDTIVVDEFVHALTDNLLKKWYPLVLDHDFGGYFTNVTHDWKLAPQQEKMIVAQARHVWTTSRIAGIFKDAATYEKIARHGYVFLRDYMWDKQFGGFYQIRSRQGAFSDFRGWREEKRTYGNAFGIYGLAALYGLTHDQEVLAFARRAFSWIEDHAFDPHYKGYFQFLTREGKVFDRNSAYKTIADDGNELGYKDQNSSIHLLEAYTELYKVWKEPKLREKLLSILTLIRDTMVTEKGYLQLFFQADWVPVSFRDATPEVREQNYGLDHVSFGHDYETAFLMLEASHALGIKNDTETLKTARRMLDHAMANGWDNDLGGFYDAGYYFKGEERCTIIRNTKNWWAQAEGLNALLLFSRIFPDDPRYYARFVKQWNYVKAYVLDNEQGDWFEGGLDKEPQFRNGPKSHIWKCTYHTTRALVNCIMFLTDRPAADINKGFSQRREELMEFVEHWRETARRS